jgi:hypothetical protein
MKRENPNRRRAMSNVNGQSDSASVPGVQGNNAFGGQGVGGDGVFGVSQRGTGVHGFSQANGMGVFGESNDSDGVFGWSHSTGSAGVHGRGDTGPAGFFDGNVVCTGNLEASRNINAGGRLMVQRNDVATAAKIAIIKECLRILETDALRIPDQNFNNLVNQL